MKSKFIYLSLILIYLLTTSFQCGKCKNGDLHIGSSRSWFPLKGKTKLTFRDNSSNLTDFPLLVIDTTEISTNLDCNSIYKYDYIRTTLFLNSSLSDTISFSLSPGDWLCVHAMTGSNFNIAMCNVFGQTKEGIVAQKMSNKSIGLNTYKEVILLLPSQGYSSDIDSVYIANNYGIVGFNYFNQKYTLY